MKPASILEINKMTIYTITLVYSADEKRTTGQDGIRCVGYHTDLEKAIKVVKSNEGDMHECRYDHVVIEEMPEGVWRQATKELWFVWKKNKWAECKKP